MTIKQMMSLGCKGFSQDQMDAEMDRRLKVAERINKLGGILPTVTDKAKKNRIIREMQSIKADESVWLKEVAWFLY